MKFWPTFENGFTTPPFRCGYDYVVAAAVVFLFLIAVAV